MGSTSTKKGKLDLLKATRKCASAGVPTRDPQGVGFRTKGSLVRTPAGDEAGDYVVPNVLSPRDLVFRPDNMDETVPHTVY